MGFGLFNNAINKKCLQIMYFIYMYKEDLVLNNLQWLFCYKTIPNEINMYKEDLVLNKLEDWFAIKPN